MVGLLRVQVNEYNSAGISSAALRVLCMPRVCNIVNSHDVDVQIAEPL